MTGWLSKIDESMPLIQPDGMEEEMDKKEEGMDKKMEEGIASRDDFASYMFSLRESKGFI